ncbi:MAG: galactokinase [Verrucomicrobiales bacterium]
MISDYFEKSFGRKPTNTAYAPGRIEFIGNHTDYNGGEVLGAAVNRGITVAVAPNNLEVIRFASPFIEGIIEIPVEGFTKQEGSASSANYPLGLVSIMRDEGYPVTGGFDFADSSNLPSGAGLSSSAAIELATAYALAGMHGLTIDRKKMALMGRRAENEFVGMPCGILDQGVSAFGHLDSLVHIDCFTEEFSTVAMPAGCHFWIFNTNKKHALVDGSYEDRFRECSEAFEILKAGGQDAACLAHIEPDAVRNAAAELGEVRMKRALHVTEENRRVRQAVTSLAQGDLQKVGQLLCASHNSSQHLFENSIAELDYLAKHIAPLKGVYGARLTGGGWGGAVMALTDETFSDQNEDLQKVLEAYHKEYGLESTVFHATAGDGATLLGE